MKVTEIEEHQIPNILAASTQKILIDVYASWCEPCQLMRPVLDAVAAETDDCEFYAVDTDAAPTFSEQYSVEIVPTFLIFKRGALVSRLVGPKTKSALLAALNSAD